MSIGAKPYTWNKNGRDETRGAMVRGSREQDIWIPGYRLRKVADQLHDIADKIDEEERGTTE